MARPLLGVARDEPDSVSESAVAGPRGRLCLGVANDLPMSGCSTDDSAETLVKDLDGADSLVARLVGEMGAAWRRGESPPAESFLGRHPELQGRDDAAVRLIYEEVCLRRELGRDVPTEEFVRRFPQWGPDLLGLIDMAYPSGPVSPRPSPAMVGDALGEFRLVEVLGRGVRGHVFLAVQPALADRPVVLKVTPRDGREHLALARLQHPHVVPLYWVQDLPEKDLRVLCMPFLGGATLAQLLDAIAETPPRRRVGRDLLEALDSAQAGRPLPAPAGGPSRRFLAGASYARAICWIGACLADALRDAHSRGLVHLDVKPSNVLLSADGTPMLLDFHLARGPIRPDGPRPLRMGGSPPYMPPEQRAAMASAREGSDIRADVDGRADIYALGVLMLEALGGGTPAPFGLPPTARQIRRRTGVGVGLSDLLARCLAADPRDRYPDAGLLAEDLRRHLSDLPLRGVANRSLAERWRRRHGRRPPGSGFAAAVLAAAIVFGLVAAGDARRRLGGAEAALAEGRGHLQAREYDRAGQSLARALALADRPFPLDLALPRARTLRASATADLERARRALKAEELHALAERARFLSGANLPPEAARGLVESLAEVWRRRGQMLPTPPELDADPEGAGRLREDLVDIAILGADLRVRLAPSGEARDAARRAALATLDEVETLAGPGPAVELGRLHLDRDLGLVEEARAASRRAEGLTPATSREHYEVGRALLAAGSEAAALREFERAAELRPGDFWPHFSRGLCAYRLGRFADAVESFDICIALAPRAAECYANRARAREALGRGQDAERDYDRALELDPALSGAALDRGVLRLRAGRHDEASADFRRALESGADPATVRRNLDLAQLARRKADAAQAVPPPDSTLVEAGELRLRRKLRRESAPARRALPGGRGQLAEGPGAGGAGPSRVTGGGGSRAARSSPAPTP